VDTVHYHGVASGFCRPATRKISSALTPHVADKVTRPDRGRQHREGLPLRRGCSPNWGGARRGLLKLAPALEEWGGGGQPYEV